MGFVDRIAAAPITWGVDGSPGWGYLVSRDRYVQEMTSLGLRATELGPDGFLPADPDELKAYLQQQDLQVVGGWVPIAMAFQDLFNERIEYLHRACLQFHLGGAEVLVLGPVWDYLDYQKKGVLSSEEWDSFFANLSRVDEISAGYGLKTALHQHMGTVIEDASDLQRVLDHSSVSLCLDTGHMLCAGIDPVQVVRSDPARICHAHLKDVSLALANRVVAGDLRFDDAVKAGLFRPLGNADVDLVSVITTLEAAGYQGWYAIEQDCFLTEDPPADHGPVQDCRISYQYLLDLAKEQGW
jgi:inosose dehydratase